EAERRRHISITSGHLALGILRESKCLAARLLNEHEMTREAVEGLMGTPAPEPPPTCWPAGPLAQRIAGQATSAHAHLGAISEDEAAHRLKRREWTRKQAIGHLIDLATAHHQWLARALVKPRVTALSYPATEWTAAQNYDGLRWNQLTALWFELH